MGGIAVPGRSSEEKKANFEAMVRENLAAGRQVKLESETFRLSGLMDYVHDGIPLNSTQRKTKKVSWRYDGKRKLDKDVNLF